MKLNDADRIRINTAAEHMTQAMFKTFEQGAPSLMEKFRLSGQQFNVAIAKSAISVMITCATSAGAEQGDTDDVIADKAIVLVRDLEAILYKAIGVEP